VVRATVHRYAIDANRDPGWRLALSRAGDHGLVPADRFRRAAIWQPGQEPGGDEITDRTALWHAPYHAALAAEVARVRALHGVAILWDCHSIRSRIPFLFEGELPVFNIGTDGGATCAPAVEATVAGHCAQAPGGHVVNGRFRGGWTTRHYGRPPRAAMRSRWNWRSAPT
jgi:N-formylglutamate deformylase